MTSRVQKGGALFRPLAKSRPVRPSAEPSRQPSVAAESTPLLLPPPSEVDELSGHAPTSAKETSKTSRPLPQLPTPVEDALQPTEFEDVQPTESATLTQPPQILPSLTSDEPGDSAIRSSNRNGPPVIKPSQPTRGTPLAIGHSRAIPSIVSAPKPRPIAKPSGSRRPLRVAPTSSPSPVPSATADPLPSSTAVDSSNINDQLGTPPADVVPTSVPQSPTAQPEADTQPSDPPVEPPSNSQKGKRKPRKKKKGADDEAGSVAPNAEDEGQSSIATRKPRRARAKKAEPVELPAEGSAASGTEADPDAPRPKRKRKARQTPPLSDTVAAASDDDGSATPAPAKRSRKRASSTPAKRAGRRKRPQTPPFDPDADPGSDLDPTVVTMAALCADTGQGRVSSRGAQIQQNFVAWKQSSREKRARMRAVAEAKKYGRDEDEVTKEEAGEGEEEEAGAQGEEAGPSVKERAPSSQPDETVEDASGAGFNYNSSMGTSKFNVQVRLGPNGEMIVDESTLFVDRGEDDENMEGYTQIEESDATKFVNAMSYSKKAGRGSRWSAEETELFFDAIQQFGENYELISLLLPGRDRKSCKNKFKAEDKKNSNRINWCLSHRVPYDMETLTRLTGKDFTGPTPDISAPEPPGSPNEVRKQSRTPGPDGADTLGEKAPSDDELETEDQQLRSSVRKSASKSRSPPRKTGRSKERKGNPDNEGVEVLGTVDDDWGDDD